MSKVIIMVCDNYEEDNIYSLLRCGMNELGGISHFVSADEKILVKPNFLSPSEEDKAIVTHPSVLRSVLRILNEEGCNNVIYGDSPGHGTSVAAAAKAGLRPVEYGASLAEMNKEVYTEFPDGLTAKEFYFAKEVTQADAIINVCKMKTHQLETITGAVKNLYGLICGARKGAGHVKFPKAEVFARMLCDIHRCVKPRLHVMDGIVAMEGNGPASGVPVKMNVLLMSEDPVALDTVFCYLIDLDPKNVPTNYMGYDMGIGTYLEDEIEMLIIDSKDQSARSISREELLKQYGNPEFDVMRTTGQKGALGLLSQFARGLSHKPVIDRNKCIHCGICVSHCPVPGKAVDFANGKDQPPVYDYKKCIRCFCCQEMCPEKAISAK